MLWQNLRLGNDGPLFPKVQQRLEKMVNIYRLN